MTATGEEPRRILLIDDNRDSVDVMADLFHYMGYETQKAYGGMEAIAIAAWFSPEVIISDLSMPIMDGLAVSRALRRMPNVSNAAILIVTGFWGKTAGAAEEAGVDLILLKPASLENILSSMHSAIRTRSRTAGTSGLGVVFRR